MPSAYYSLNVPGRRRIRPLKSHVSSPIRMGLLGALLHAGTISAQIPSAAGVPLDPDGFTATVAQMVNNSGVSDPVHVASSLTLKTRGAGRTDIQINLDRIYQACQGDQPDCRELLAHFVVGIHEQLSAVPTPVQPAKLRVVVRPASYLQDPQFAKILIPATLPTMPAGLVAFLYVDQPTTMRIATTRDLENLHVSAKQAYEIAVRNTASELQPFGQAIQMLSAGQIGVVRDSPYESSRLLLHGNWQELVQRFGGHLLVAVPSAEELIYAEGGSKESINGFSKIAHDRFLRAQRGISPSVFEWQPNHWVLLAP
jgi:uncharacterized protein YtpQ (UPF0354 family)